MKLYCQFTSRIQLFPRQQLNEHFSVKTFANFGSMRAKLHEVILFPHHILDSDIVRGSIAVINPLSAAPLTMRN